MSILKIELMPAFICLERQLNQVTHRHENMALRDIYTRDIRKNWSFAKVKPFFSKKRQRSFWIVEHGQLMELLKKWYMFKHKMVMRGIFYDMTRYGSDDPDPWIKLEMNQLIYLNNVRTPLGELRSFDTVSVDLEYRFNRISKADIINLSEKLLGETHPRH